MADDERGQNQALGDDPAIHKRCAISRLGSSFGEGNASEVVDAIRSQSPPGWADQALQPGHYAKRQKPVPFCCSYISKVDEYRLRLNASQFSDFNKQYP